MSSSNILVATVVATEENSSKFQEIKIKEKFRKPLISLGFRNFYGGDKRDRTADLLNAIQVKDGLNTRFLVFLVATW